MKNIVLVGGPYDDLVCIYEAPLPEELRFPAEPRKDHLGRPSVCAPRATPDGPVVYRSAGGVNIVGDPVYRYDAEGGAA